jgi:hypothetical protein
LFAAVVRRITSTFLLALDRQSIGADIDMQAFGLMAVLIKLIAQDRDGHDQRAED